MTTIIHFLLAEILISRNSFPKNIFPKLPVSAWHSYLVSKPLIHKYKYKIVLYTYTYRWCFPSRYFVILLWLVLLFISSLLLLDVNRVIPRYLKAVHLFIMPLSIISTLPFSPAIRYSVLFMFIQKTQFYIILVVTLLTWNWNRNWKYSPKSSL